MLQTDVKVFGLVRLHTAQGHPRLPNELIMCQLVFVAHGHPGSERQGGDWGGGYRMRNEERTMGRARSMNQNKSSWLLQWHNRAIVGMEFNYRAG